MDAILIVSQILAVYSFSIMILGTIFNMICLTVCVRYRIRKIPTFVFMAFMMATDTVTLFFWNLDHFLNTFYGYMIEYISVSTCRFSTFMQLFSLQSSAWLLVALSLERYLSVELKNWRQSWFNSTKAAIVSTVIIAVAFLTNIHLVITIDYSNMVNVTAPGICFYTDMFTLWKQVHTYLYSIVPFILLVLVNSLLIYRTVNPGKSIRRSNEERTKRKNISISIVIMTVSFIVLTIPNAIAGGYYIGLLFQTRLGTLGIFITDSLLFSYHSFNFMVFMLSNKKFAEEFHRLVESIRTRNRIGMESGARTRTVTTAH